MEMPEFIERNVRDFMRPIQEAGYTILPYEKGVGSLEGQLRSYLLFACDEVTLDRVESVWYGGSLETSNFAISLKTIIETDKVEFKFKGSFDPKYELPAQLKGMQVAIGSYEAYYPLCTEKAFPKPGEAYKASRQTTRMKPNSSIRIVKNWLGKGKKL